MLNQDNIVPLYEQLMNILEHDIRTGKYSPGDRIMTESELSKKYGISLITVRKAISLLTEKAGQGNLCRQTEIFPEHPPPVRLYADVRADGCCAGRPHAR